MYSYKITFIPLVHNSKQTEISDDMFWDYLGCLYQNGQIQRNYEMIYTNSNVTVLVTLPEMNSLSDIYKNLYVRKAEEKLAAEYISEFEFLGENARFSQECTCREETHYILYTNYYTEDSPILCGRCMKPVPLYRLPYILGESEYHSVLIWRESYRNLDKLFMYGIEDALVLSQLQNPNSSITEIGKDICAQFSLKKKKPFYYYLFSYEKVYSPECPSCKKNCSVDSEKNLYFCDRCGIVYGDPPT